LKRIKVLPSLHLQADSKDSKKKGTNSIDNLDSPSSESKKSLVPSSPSALSTSSNCSTDREKKVRVRDKILLYYSIAINSVLKE